MNKSSYANTANVPEPRKRYPSDLTDQEWPLISPYVGKAPGPGRKRTVNMREVLNALFYLDRTGCQWRYLPKEFPNHNTVYYYFAKWTEDGTLERINAILRRDLRHLLGRDAEPSLGVIDSQTVQTTEAGGPRGYDGAKQTNGRKRHIMVDTLGLLLILVVHIASISDEEGSEGMFVAAEQKLPRLQKVVADSAYKWNGLVERVRAGFQFVLEIIERDPTKRGFYVLPKRWIVERTFAWLCRNRRLSKDYEQREATSESMIYLASIRLMLKRLDRMKTA